MISQKRAREVINFARDLKKHWGTDDPYILAKLYGFSVTNKESCYPGFTAQIVCLDNNTRMISINDEYTEFSKKILCAHELGHAFLHSEEVCNHFAGGHSKETLKAEQEANLFALALLTDSIFDASLAVPLEKMSNYLLKSILDYNLTKK